jgi:hypothetical protein
LFAFSFVCLVFFGFPFVFFTSRNTNIKHSTVNLSCSREIGRLLTAQHHRILT